jgi:hypothetical protein
LTHYRFAVGIAKATAPQARKILAPPFRAG